MTNPFPSDVDDLREDIARFRPGRNGSSAKTAVARRPPSPEALARKQQRLDNKLRDERALEMAIIGVRLSAIRENCGYKNDDDVRSGIQRAIARRKWQDDAVERERTLQNEVLNDAKFQVMQIIRSKDPSLEIGDRLKAIDKLVTVEHRRAKLLGLDAPARTELTGADGTPLLPPEVFRAMQERVERARAKIEKLDKGEPFDGEVVEGEYLALPSGEE